MLSQKSPYGAALAMLLLSWALCSCGVAEPTVVVQSGTPTSMATVLVSTPSAPALEMAYPIGTTLPTTTPGLPAPTPLATPALAQPVPQVADTLPLDQPWVWRGPPLFSVNQLGEVTQLSLPVTGWVPRPRRPPLLLNTSTPGQLTVIEPETWTQRVFTFDAAIAARTFALSPTGSELAFTGAIAAGRDTRDQVSIADLTTGVVQNIFEAPQSIGDDREYPYGDALELIAWKGSTLYFHTQASATSGFWSMDLSAPEHTPKPVYWMGDGGYWDMQPQGELLAAPPNLVNLRTGETRPFMDSAAQASFSPDGSMLAFLSLPDRNGNTELRRYDLATGATTGLYSFPKHQEGDPVWSDDGQRILVQTSTFTMSGGEVLGRSARHIWVFSRDGVLSGDAVLPEDFNTGSSLVDSFWLVDDRQLLVSVRAGDNTSLRYIPLQHDATLHAPPVWLPGTGGPIYTILYVPHKPPLS